MKRGYTSLSAAAKSSLPILSSIDLPKLRADDGPLTQQMVLTPARFGLGQVPHNLLPDATTTLTCGFCSTGCGLNVHLRDGKAINLTPSTGYPVNLGMACPKGWEALRVLDANDRATQPLLRHSNGSLQPVSWEVALQHFCESFKNIQEVYGDQSVAFISTGQITCEEMALLGCLAKFGMGLVHGDGNTRQCMATAATAYKQSFGFDAPPFSYADFECSDVLVFVGANPCIAHPIMWQRVLRNPNNPEIIVIDPRTTETASAATEHVQLRPKSDLVLLYGIASELIRTGAVDRDFIENHTNDFDAFAAHVQAYSLERTSAETGVEVAQLNRLVSKIPGGKRVSFWWTMGVNQSYQGTRTAQAIINLALMTGNIGRPGTGANSITGQCNAMGSRLFSNTSSLLGGRSFQSYKDRERIAEVLDIPLERIPTSDSWAYDQIISGIESGHIKGLWIIATNTAHSWINSQRGRQLLDKLEFLVVQDMYQTTETVLHADLVLPAAGWGEKEGTFINSERRLGLTKRVAAAPGEALADFSIFRLIADAWGCGSLFEKWTSPAAAFEQLKRISVGQPCDISGIEGYEMIDRLGGIQWPWPAGSGDSPAQERRLFENGEFYHVDGRAKFIFAEPQAMPEPPDADFPFLLLTGRGTVAQWHTQTRTAKSSVLRKLYPQEMYIEMNSRDASELLVQSGDSVQIISRRGRAVAQVMVSNTVRPRQVFLPMHYAEVNHLTLEHVDPYSRQPSYKDCAVRIERVSR
jgi:anaerobic selenocysteine-containing dehydrogenase